MDATLRAAAPYQRSRRKRAEDENRKLRRVYVEKGRHAQVNPGFKGFPGFMT